MMHGRGKSDSAIVAVKPTNKAARPAAEQSAMELAAAEPVEPRAETKGNAGQQSTHRTPSRVVVSQALERIRKVFAVRTRGRSRMRESRTSGSVRGALSNERPLYVATRTANEQILLSSEENGEPLASLWRMSLCGRLGPVFQAPLFRLDGILGRA